MGAPHNKSRYGERWPQYRIDAQLVELAHLKQMVVLSGGWAWHFMSPTGHAELKHAHDHKDIDIFVEASSVAAAVSTLKARGFERAWTRYDRLESDEDFRRYTKVLENPGKPPFKAVIDFFVRDVPQIEEKGWRVVEPSFLLSLYSNIHSSDKCFAVQAARRLLAAGESPVGRAELVQVPE
jgi:hypothetical protein